MLHYNFLNVSSIMLTHVRIVRNRIFETKFGQKQNVKSIPLVKILTRIDRYYSCNLSTCEIVE